MLFLIFRGTARWGSSCSGTESPAFCLRELWQELEREKPGCTLPPVRTVVSCEKVAEKRDFIERTAPYRADASYGDIFDLCKSRAPFPKDTRTKKQLQPALEQLLFYIAGFSCKTVSGLNCADLENAFAVASGLGSTGETLQGVLDVLSRWGPLVVILENVLGLRRNGQKFLVQARVKAMGYIIAEQQINTDQLGLPQARQRLWFVAIRADFVALSQMPESFVVDALLATFRRLLHDVSYDCPPLSNLLLDENDAELIATRKTIERGLARGTITGSVGPGNAPMTQDGVSAKRKMEREAAQGTGSHWTPSLGNAYPEYYRLSEREKSLLDSCQVRFPDQSLKVVGVGQNEPVLMIDKTPTVTPTCTIWIGARGRLLRGAEALRIQGIWLPRSRERMFADGLLLDLGGNSFSTPACTVAMLTSLVVLSDLWQRRCSIRQAALEFSNYELVVMDSHFR